MGSTVTNYHCRLLLWENSNKLIDRPLPSVMREKKTRKKMPLELNWLEKKGKKPRWLRSTPWALPMHPWACQPEQESCRLRRGHVDLTCSVCVKANSQFIMGMFGEAAFLFPSPSVQKKCDYSSVSTKTSVKLPLPGPQLWRTPLPNLLWKHSHHRTEQVCESLELLHQFLQTQSSCKCFTENTVGLWPGQAARDRLQSVGDVVLDIPTAVW